MICSSKAVHLLRICRQASPVQYTAHNCARVFLQCVWVSFFADRRRPVTERVFFPEASPSPAPTPCARSCHVRTVFVGSGRLSYAIGRMFLGGARKKKARDGAQIRASGAYALQPPWKYKLRASRSFRRRPLFQMCCFCTNLNLKLRPEGPGSGPSPRQFEPELELPR